VVTRIVLTAASRSDCRTLRPASMTETTSKRAAAPAVPTVNRPRGPRVACGDVSEFDVRSRQAGELLMARFVEEADAGIAHE
jgi:hypothetical protein